MTAKEWLDLIKQAEDYNPSMTILIEKYGELYATERIKEAVPMILKDVAEKAKLERYRNLGDVLSSYRVDREHILSLSDGIIERLTKK